MAEIHFSQVEFEIPEILKGKTAAEIREIAWNDMLIDSDNHNKHKMEEFFQTIFNQVQAPESAIRGWKSPTWVGTESEDHAVVVAAIISWFHGCQCSINRTQVISAGYAA